MKLSPHVPGKIQGKVLSKMKKKIEGGEMNDEGS